ncbi:MAG TPA: DMT family transporter [Gammaproteobacteria bacterium]|nr:DMT family transporter [Gammaproteobacteria bacterium]
MEQQTRAYLFASATILFWSTVASAFKLTLGYISSEELLFYSTFFSLLILGAIVVASGRLGELRRWPAVEFFRSALLGFLNPFLYYLVVFKAYSLLPAQEALTLNFIWPIVLVLFSIVILRQRITVKTLLAMVISFSGALVISTRGDVLGFRVTHPLGAGLALGSSAVWALYWVYGAKDTQDAISRLCVNFIFGFVFVALYMTIFSSPRLVGPEGLFGSLYVGAFEMGITYVVWLYALRLSQTTAQVSNLIYLTPFLSLIVVHFTVGEQIFGSTVAGLILIVGGIMLQHYGRRRTVLARG